MLAMLKKSSNNGTRDTVSNRNDPLVDRTWGTCGGLQGEGAGGVTRLPAHSHPLPLRTTTVGRAAVLPGWLLHNAAQSGPITAAAMLAIATVLTLLQLFVSALLVLSYLRGCWVPVGHPRTARHACSTRLSLHRATPPRGWKSCRGRARRCASWRPSPVLPADAACGRWQLAGSTR